MKSIQPARQLILSFGGMRRVAWVPAP